MFGAVARRLFGSANDRLIRSLNKTIQAITTLEPMVRELNDDGLRARTNVFRARLAAGARPEILLVEAFATVREAALRTLGQRPFDVQLLGGLVLHQGKIAEMKTGEGKTLAATLSVYLNALSGQGVHVVTANDYLASRDAEWMGQIYRFLGLAVGVIIHGMSDSERRAAYACDVVYATNNELGFDYLRDNMKFNLEDMVQRPFHYAIVDEVDSILIDEARTPLIVSGPSEDCLDLYIQVDQLIPRLGAVHFEKDEKARAVTLTEEGAEYIEKLLTQTNLLRGEGLYDVGNLSLVHHINQALRAHKLFTRDVDYIVKDDRVIIIDEFTGRMMEGRRYSDGLHQALEAKEKVTVQNENQTLASITFQNYFRLYPKLAGMTGTAMTESSEFQEIYGLEVVAIPTNVPVVRQDMHDEVYRTAREKSQAILKNIKDCHARCQPVLVGTTSIEKSELLAGRLQAGGIPHKVLNARYHEQEAYIIAEAGVPGAVTIATNMAGRGTDIQLGGNAAMRLKQDLAISHDKTVTEAQHDHTAKVYQEVAERRQIAMAAGGLFVIGTERHESRRIDNQLRGRSGRQGDPGASRFFLSLEDDLMRIFGSERMDKMLQTLGLQEGEAIIHPWINKALEKAQQKVEARNFEIRKNLLKFDDVMNDQRKVVYEQRREVMTAADVHQTIVDMRSQVIDDLFARFTPERTLPEQWNAQGLHEECLRVLGLDLPMADWCSEEGITAGAIRNRVTEASDRLVVEKTARFGLEFLRRIEKGVLLQVLDQIWKEHLLTLDHLRQGIGLRAYGQRDPLNEYKQESFALFEHMLTQLRERITAILSHVTFTLQEEKEASQIVFALPPQEASPFSASYTPTTPREDKWQRTPVASTRGKKSKIRRNDLCPCGSGRKFKHCHG
ncbi:Protein export cytoplasm protein SecA ATPase RNA helicase (TC 3.A.5.1.1) [invertebrate metagenome]|uniref:Protein export cytoplasm protein SecA ATPase RNA helicase (TC 3.A.5.1.1) n=1 Tax=invertebrate metagenome TaxID=1711999 RepID=A0A484H601_9ZZZZ